MPSPFTPIVDAGIYTLRPDYCAISVLADGLINLACHPLVDRYVEETLGRPTPPPWTDAHLESWRAAYRAFGVKPQRTPCSVDALLARVRKDARMPTVNAVVDLYNAISVGYAIPVGGENVAAYVGSPRLFRASGAESFDSFQGGQPVSESVPQGEVVWGDEQGVTCRRWNWRQGMRTRIDLSTRRAWFVFERLDPMPVSAAIDAATVLVERLRLMNPRANFSIRRIEGTGAAAVAGAPARPPAADL